jgi:hypothetical protein
MMALRRRIEALEAKRPKRSDLDLDRLNSAQRDRLAALWATFAREPAAMPDAELALLEGLVMLADPDLGTAYGIHGTPDSIARGACMCAYCTLPRRAMRIGWPAT